MSLPSRPIGGMEWSADAIARHVQETAARATVSASPGLIGQRGGGAVIMQRPTGLQPAPRRSFTPAHPFKVVNRSDDEDARIGVVFGQVNSLTPTLGGDDLDADPSPSIVVTTSGVIYLRVSFDVDGVVINADIHNDEELPGADASYGYITLATITLDDDKITAINQAVSFSLGCRRCGVSDIHFWGL